MEPDSKELVKFIRDKEKDLWKELSEYYLGHKTKEILEVIRCCRKPMEGLTELTLKFMKAFSEYKREKNVLDFTDMEHFALKILVKKEDGKLTPTQAARELSARYDEVMVDEYQDSNEV